MELRNVWREKKVLHTYIQKSSEWMLKVASNEKIHQEEGRFKDYKKGTYEEKKTEEIGTDESWRCLKICLLKERLRT